MLETLGHFQNLNQLTEIPICGYIFPVVYECDTYLDEERELQPLENMFLWEVWVQFSVLHTDELRALYEGC
jgi:hypothetical protein